MDKSRGKKIAAGVGGALVVLLFGAWWLGLIGRSIDPEVAAVQRVFDEALASGGPPPREVMEERMASLTESQRRQFFMQNRDRMREMITRRMTETLQLPPDELRQVIAEGADRVVAARENGEDDDFPGPPGGGPGGPGMGDMSQAERVKRVLGFTTPAMRGAFTEMKRLFDAELESRGENPIEPREMRRAMRGRQG